MDISVIVLPIHTDQLPGQKKSRIYLIKAWQHIIKKGHLCDAFIAKYIKKSR